MAIPVWGPKVVMSNRLTRWGHGLTLSEKRVVALAISKLRSTTVINDRGRGYRTKIFAEEYIEAYGVTASTAYKQLIAATVMLPVRRISGFVPEHRRNGKAIEVVPLRWIVGAWHLRSEGTVEFEWNPEIVPELLAQRREFTVVPLGFVGSLKTATAWRIFELVCLFPDSGRVSFVREDLLVSLDVTDSGWKDFGAVRRRYIRPAVEEINRTLGIGLVFRIDRRGRKTSKIHFSYSAPLFPVGVIGKRPVENLCKTCD